MRNAVILPRAARVLTWILFWGQFALFEVLLVNHGGKKHLYWLLADVPVLLLSLLACAWPARFSSLMCAVLRKFRRPMSREVGLTMTTSDGIEQEAGDELLQRTARTLQARSGGPYWICWLLYVLVISGKIWHALLALDEDFMKKRHSHEGDTSMRLCLAVTAVTFVTFVVGFYYEYLNPDYRWNERFYFYKVCWVETLEIIDATDFLEFFVERLEHNKKISKGVEFTGLSIVSLTLMLTTLQLCKLGWGYWNETADDEILHASGKASLYGKLTVNAGLFSLLVYLLTAHKISVSMLFVKNAMVVCWLLWIIYWAHKQVRVRTESVSTRLEPSATVATETECATVGSSGENWRNKLNIKSSTLKRSATTPQHLVGIDHTEQPDLTVENQTRRQSL